MSMTLLPGSIIAMTDQAADRLLRLGSGDAALLYIHLLRKGNVEGMGWTPERLDAALNALIEQGLAPKQTPIPDKPQSIAEAPEYLQEDINAVLADPTHGFSALCDEVERQMGKKLNGMELKSLMTLYDHLGLPTEVIILLVNWCAEQTRRKYGPGKRPSMTTIRKEGFAWARKGIDTLERADEHIARLGRLHSREGEVLRLLDIPQRPLVERERTYIAAWDDMGFDNESIRMAYERTVLKKQAMDWGYMNAILRRWHEKGLHTAAAVAAADRDYRPRAGMVAGGTIPTQSNPTPQQDDARDIMRMLEQMKQEG